MAVALATAPFHYYLFTILDADHNLTPEPPADRIGTYLWTRLYLEATQSPIPHLRVMGDFADLPLADLEHVYRELERWRTRQWTCQP